MLIKNSKVEAIFKAVCYWKQYFSLKKYDYVVLLVHYISAVEMYISDRLWSVVSKQQMASTAN